MVNTVGEYSWNITSVVKKWYTTNKNYGVMLKTNNESVLGYTDFYSCDIDESLEAKRPKVSISYVNNAGLEDYWTYHSMDMGRAGTINVNDYNGNYVLVHNDLETTGSRMPISVNHVYNSYQRGATLGYGQGWRLNIRQTIQKQTINGQLYYIYADGDGTRHYYKSGTSPMSAESGIDLKLTVNSTTTLTLEDTSYSKMSFSTIGSDTNNFYLKSVTDKNANSMVIDYQGTKPSMVTDGAGRKATLTYNTDGNLSLITDPANKVTRFDYTGANLTKITYPDNKVTQYNYTASGNITDAINHDGYKMGLEYYLEVPYRVKAIKESHSDGTQGQKITMEYGSNNTTFTDIEGRKNILQFNNEGNIL
jgi:YD repeat-containing protein